ncbi:chloroplast envelope protein translocase family [Dorcoceras hygrometricum]|uniref:Chloroplast envelope protein translocase family n=1 Tax=Dorcoceras hygrometricum TaxID=472368 RepID=A0A2Z7BB52_9LAMI|nr:chloroplast envelope protein translocase family [Dorcoceras hygrometricum]
MECDALNKPPRDPRTEQRAPSQARDTSSGDAQGPALSKEVNRPRRHSKIGISARLDHQFGSISRGPCPGVLKNPAWIRTHGKHFPPSSARRSTWYPTPELLLPSRWCWPFD